MPRTVGLGTFKADAYTRAFVNDVLDKGRLSYGEYSKKFESSFAKLHECQYGVLSNSGTSSLHVALQALKELHGWEDGDKVIVPAVTFVATVNVVLHNRMTAVLVDVEMLTYNIDPDKIENVGAKCIMPVHLFGQPANMTPIKHLAQAYGMAIIEDSCETMFATHHGHSVGSWGDIGCFSLYMAHLITAGVGGIATTNNPDYAAKMRSLVNHGRDGIYISIDDDNDADNIEDIMAKRFKFDSVGHSFRVTELEAAVAMAQLLTWEDMIAKRQANAKYLSAGLAHLKEYLYLPMTRVFNTHSYMMYPIVMKYGDKWGMCRHLESCGIETREMLPITTQPVYQELLKDQGPFPIAETINKLGFYVGCHQGLDKPDLDRIINAIDHYFS